MVRFAALDISTKTGLCIVNVHGSGEWEIATACEVTAKLDDSRFKTFKRAHEIAYLTRCILDNGRDCIPDLAIIENFAYGNHFTLSMLTEITTLIKDTLYDLDIPYVTIAPKALKKFITNNGAADKKHMAKMCKERYNFEHKSDNVIDAFALAQVLVAVWNGAKVNDLNREVLNVLLEKGYNA